MGGSGKSPKGSYHKAQRQQSHQDRKSFKIEPAHEVIYDALGLSYRPGRAVKTIL
jgi:hypothetical protein